MVKFCYFNGELMRCDDETIKIHNLEVVKEVTDEEFAQYGNWYVKDGEVHLGTNPSELIEQEIYELKRNLFDTDYKIMKYQEGELSEEEFEQIKEQRKSWRQRIRELESGNAI